MYACHVCLHTVNDCMKCTVMLTASAMSHLIGMSVLVLFIYHMLKIFYTLSGNDRTNNWIVNFPSTLRKVQQEIIGDNINFKDYVVCPKCYALYDFDSCIETRASTCTSHQCLYVKLPNHTRPSCRLPCGSPLLRSLKKFSNIISAIQSLLLSKLERLCLQIDKMKRLFRGM